MCVISISLKLARSASLTKGCYEEHILFRCFAINNSTKSELYSYTHYYSRNGTYIIHTYISDVNQKLLVHVDVTRTGRQNEFLSKNPWRIHGLQTRPISFYTSVNAQTQAIRMMGAELADKQQNLLIEHDWLACLPFQGADRVNWDNKVSGFIGFLYLRNIATQLGEDQTSWKNSNKALLTHVCMLPCRRAYEYPWQWSFFDTGTQKRSLLYCRGPAPVLGQSIWCYPTNLVSFWNIAKLWYVMGKNS